jgi:type IV pilus assembly protein PilQ
MAMTATLSKIFSGRHTGSWMAYLAASALFLASGFVSVQAADPATGNTLTAIDFAGLPGDRAQITLTLDSPASAPLSFTIDNPARIALDLPNTRNGLGKRTHGIGIGMAESVTTVEAQGRTRVIVNLAEMVPYETRAEGNKVIVTVQGSGKQLSTAAAMVAQAKGGARPQVENVDFRRGEEGQGRVIVSLSDPSIPADMQQEGGKVIVDFYRARLPAELERRLDVVDFATPVKTVDTRTRGDNVHMVITPMGEYEHLAYQTGNQFIIEVREITRKEAEDRKKDEFGYVGERLSLNFQDIEVRSVLQLIADFTGINIVVSDTVSGSLTLRLKNVPWDQALDIILKTKGLAMRQAGNVMLVAPSEEIAAREKLELESQKQIEELEPLYSEFIQVNYAKSAELSALLKTSEASLLSDRGTVIIDERTNTLLVQDTADKLVEIRKLVAKLDIPVRQVLIESRIVLANDDYSRDLGVRLGLTATADVGSDGAFATTGSVFGTDDMINQAADNINSGANPFPVDLPNINNRLNVNSPVNSIGRIAMALLDSDYLLDLELTAMQREGKGEVISSPRVITSNAQEALIESGTEIPYQEASSSGATSVSFKKAVLSLQVTPQITPDDRIIMDLTVNKDKVGEVFNFVPSIDTQEVRTQVLVNNGQTLVLGGIYEQTIRDEVDKVPFLGDLPGLGYLFRTTRKTNEMEELLIFVTPKILKEGLIAN